MENIEVFEDSNGEWRFRIKANNGEIVAVSEAYTVQASAYRGADTLKRILDPEVPPLEEVEGSPKEISRASDGGLPRQPSTRVDELIAAAHCYLSAAHLGNSYDLRMVPMGWPWKRSDWKPGTKLENMEKAEAILRETIELYRGKDGEQE